MSSGVDAQTFSVLLCPPARCTAPGTLMRAFMSSSTTSFSVMFFPESFPASAVSLNAQ